MVLLVGAVAISLLMMELFLRVLENRIGSGKFTLLPASAHESLYFHYRVPGSPVPKINFDALLGWRNVARPLLDGKRETLTRDSWRGPREFSDSREAHRVILTGDSFAFGWSVDDGETLSTYLEQELGAQFEVMNMAAEGYGIDQMSLVATELAPRYNPETVIIAFTADDLNRSCYAFNFTARKPYFEWRDDHLVLSGIPVATPDETLAEHARVGARMKDTAVALATYSRVVCLFGQIALQRGYQSCLTDLNVAILRDVWLKLRDQTKLVFVHLDGDLPSDFEQQVRRVGPTYVSVPPLIPSLSKAMHIQPEYQADGHPKGSFYRLAARAIAQALER